MRSEISSAPARSHRRAPPLLRWEWNLFEAIDHSADAVFAMQYFSRFVGTEARKSSHAFASVADLQSRLIYNFAPMRTEFVSSSFEQAYVW
jgi:hypothetical protein